jgi:hypothetical protein
MMGERGFRSGTACRCMFAPHERAVGVIVLEEGDQGRRDRDHLLRGDVHVVHFFGRDHREAVAATDPHRDPVWDEAVVLVQGACSPGRS